MKRIRYPISFAGAEQDLATAFPGSYAGPGQLEMIREGITRFLLGVTGGIVTGKTTVVNMLKEKGAPVIEFDLLARRVDDLWKRLTNFNMGRCEKKQKEGGGIKNEMDDMAGGI